MLFAGVAHEILLQDTDVVQSCDTSGAGSLPIGPGYVGKIRKILGGGTCHATWERATSAVLQSAQPSNADAEWPWMYDGVNTTKMRLDFPNFSPARDLQPGMPPTLFSCHHQEKQITSFLALTWLAAKLFRCCSSSVVRVCMHVWMYVCMYSIPFRNDLQVICGFFQALLL